MYLTMHKFTPKTRDLISIKKFLRLIPPSTVNIHQTTIFALNSIGRTQAREQRQRRNVFRISGMTNSSSAKAAVSSPGMALII